MDSLFENRGFIYPYTELRFDDVDRVTTALLLYDSISFLDYRLPMERQSPLYSHFTPTGNIGWRDSDARDCWQLLHHYSEDGLLRSIYPDDVRFGKEGTFDEKNMLRIIESNRQILQLGSVVSKAKAQGLESYLLADQKLFPKLLKKITHERGRRGMTRVPWDWGEAILLAYAELACREFNFNPIPLKEIHAESLSTVLAQRSKKSLGWIDSDGNLNPATNLILTKLVEMRFDTLRRTWTMPQYLIPKLRREIKEIRNKALEGVGKYLQEHMAQLDGPDYVPPERVTNEINDKLRDLSEEIERHTKEPKEKGRVDVAIYGLIGSSAAGLISVSLTGVIGPLALLSGIVSWTVSALVTNELVERKKKQAEGELVKLRKNPLYGTLCYIEKLEKYI